MSCSCRGATRSNVERAVTANFWRFFRPQYTLGDDGTVGRKNRSRDMRVTVRETVIVEAVRTAVGKRNGGLSGMHAADLSAVVLNELVERAGIGPEIVDDVV